MIVLAMMETWELIILLFILALAVLPTVLALIDIQKSEFQGNTKLIWLLVVIFLSFFGAILYFLIGKEQKTTTNN
ncbi:PLD nuclease N-terminal domain-containing protein [Formosa sp. Hel1_33_131]|jgi:hypothetical protein|uniref:PLD nuclease N-terminal domain-containing protein n=1 Tax=Formosa sp. Hel1_33_131 TaxID=1336794 RepID=UPI00084E0E02|nr:PLD nuclease N-terminal domain-containing protein [Formosa sp. Hel1_33_131]